MASFKIQDDDQLMRVMSKRYFGKWYVRPEEWEKLEKKGYKK